MAATIWKGVIEFGDIRVPVRFMSAVEDRSIHFHLLHKTDKTRVQQAMVNPQTGQRVPTDQIRRGFEVAPGTYVVLNENELEKSQPTESRTIRVERFVPNERANHQWYERPYFLAPDEHAVEYAALVAALAGHKLEGIARWVMRKRAYVGSLQAGHNYLMMISLRSANEVVPASSLPRPEGRALDRKELDLAAQLMSALHTDFDPAQYRDEYRQRVMDFIAAKAKGHKPRLKLVRPPKPTPADDLIAKLAASVKSLRKERASA